MKKLILCLITFSAAVGSAASIDEVIQQLGNTPYSGYSVNEADNQNIYKKYCGGKARSTDIPVPNYANPDIQLAARKLSQAKSEAFYFYSSIRKMYGLSEDMPLPKVKGVPNLTIQAHMLLVQLCGEFRDRATMIQAKIEWYKKLYVLPARIQRPIDPKANIWKQVAASSYAPYLRLSHDLWQAKRDAQPRFITVGNNESVDNPVTGTTVCETKYIFSEYVHKKKEFSDLASFQKGYQAYKAQCPKADLTDYYDFRGDSNIKHNSPESNGMIWYATSIAKACKSMDEARDNDAGITDQDCKNYFERPFYYRYNSARAGLATWLFHSEAQRGRFGSSQEEVAIYPHTRPQFAPMAYGTNHLKVVEVNEFDSNWLSIPGAWQATDIGFNQYTGMGTNKPNSFLVYDLIRSAVDRHTDWYQSTFNDRNGTLRNQAYSPLVASSYEMSESDQFTFCGITVQCEPDGHKRWMFIFRIKASNWYTPASAIKGEPVDFDKMWFDETSFGETSLADSEKAWDRLGTPMEEEMDSILYLYNISDSGELIDPMDPSIITPIED